MQAKIEPANQELHPTSQMWNLHTVLSWCRLRMRVAVGVLFNLAGVPGPVRDCDYQAGITDAHVKVRVRDLFTVIEVNGLEIFFHRLTGTIDGVGFTPCCKPGQAPESALVPAPADCRMSRKRSA